MAMTFLHYQHFAIGHLAEICQTRRPLFCMHRLAFGETGERLAIPCAGIETASVWQVLVARLQLYVGWNDDVGQQALVCKVVLPCLLVASPNAANIYHALFFWPQRLRPSLDSNSAHRKQISLCGF